MTASAETMLLERHLDELECERLLVIDPPDIDSLQMLDECLDGQIDVFTTAADVADSVREHLPETPLTLGVWMDEHLWSRAVIYLPKGKQRLEMVLAMLANAPAGLSVLLVGHKRGGIKSGKRQMEAHLDDVSKVGAAKHCTLWEGSTRGPSETPSTLDAWRTEWQAPLTPPLAVASYPGVFSHGELDEGTRCLLEHLKMFDPPDVLDLCCGAGIIGAEIARRHPTTQVYLSDVSALAVDAAQRTLALNDLSNAQCVASNLFESIEQPRFKHIVCNPPFHRGVETEYEVTRQLIEQAPSHLRRNGVLWLVVNKFRHYADALKEHLGSCESVYSDNRYHVYRAQLRHSKRKPNRRQ